MKRSISLLLALVMICACMPFTTLAKAELKENRLIDSTGRITLSQQNYINNSAAKNIKSVSSERDMQQALDLPYTEEELRAMSPDELVKNVKPYLNNSYPMDAIAHNSDIEGLKDPRTSDDEKLQRIAANKEAYLEKSQAAYEYGHKLATGETEATKSVDSRFAVVDNVILVTNQDDLMDMNNQSGYFRLANDIKLTGLWEPIDFYGTLEGNGHTISNIDMSQYGEYDGVGFFSTLGEGAVVQNVNFDYPSVYANALCGSICAENYGIINNCNVYGAVVATYLWADFEQAFWEMSGYSAGGICGVNYGIIMNCTFDGDVDGWTEIGGICGINGGIVFGTLAGGNVAYETNTWDIDEYGYNYCGEAYYFETMLRDMWAVYFLLYYDATVYGYNGGITGKNFGYMYDCCVQGKGQGYNYNVGVVGGLDCMGGLAGGDVGHIAHCYSLDRAFPVFNDGSTLLAAWDYGDNGEGIYYDWAYFLVHKCIGYSVEGAETKSSDEVFYYGSWPLPCDDGGFHGTELTADQFYNPSTFSNWNKGSWNKEWGIENVWIIEAGSVPVLMEMIPAPTEYVITYEVANAGGLLDGGYVAYRLAKPDANFNYTEPAPPTATATQSGYGITGWHPSTPAAGKPVYGDIVYKAYFGVGGSTGDDTNPSPSPTQNPHFPGPISGPTDDAGLIGDTNLDGTVNTADAAYLLKAIAQDTLSEFRPQQKTNSDTNFDKEINTYDCTRILQYCAGIIKTFR